MFTCPTGKLKSDVDSLSYMMGIATTQGLMEFVQGQGVDSTTMANFIQGLEQGCKETDANRKHTWWVCKSASR